MISAFGEMRRLIADDEAGTAIALGKAERTGCTAEVAA
jgi:hypothetical protein